MRDSNSGNAAWKACSSVGQTNVKSFGYQKEGDNVTYRATYLIDEDGIVFHESINHMPLGRNVNEYLRLIDAYTHVQEVGEVCPANWKNGAEAIKADIDSLVNYLKTN